MKNKHVFALLVLGGILIFSMCSKDDDKTPPYVGQWETETFEMMGAFAMMDVDFAESNILAEVALMVAANTYVNILGVKGNVAEKSDQILDISLTDLGQWDAASNDYDWKNRTTEPAEFEAIYQQMGLSQMIPKDFEAEYSVVGDELDLIFEVAPSVTDTINLFRK
jgi:hypothetical protein